MMLTPLLADAFILYPCGDVDRSTNALIINRNCCSMTHTLLLSAAGNPWSRPAEALVADVWRSVGVHATSPHHAFVAMGGDSLAAARAALLLRKRLVDPGSYFLTGQSHKVP